MKFSSYIESGLVFNDVAGNTKEEIIKNIIDRAAKHDGEIFRIKEMVEKTVIKREKEVSTVIGNGIFMPHARLDFYNDFLFITAILDKTVKLENAAGKFIDVKVVFMILAGNQKSKLILNLMSAVTKLSKMKDIMAKIENTNDGRDIAEIIENSEIKVDTSIDAKHMMHTEVIPVKSSDILEDVAKRFVIEGRDAFPVIDEEGRFIGEISETDIIKTGIPGYASFMMDMSFMKDDDMFEEYLKKEKNCKAGEVCNTEVSRVEESTSIVEVSFLITTTKHPKVYVIKDEKYIGEIFAKDVIKKVFYIS